LGLALSKKLAQMLGGDLRLSQSDSGKGCTFELTVNAETAEATAETKRADVIPLNQGGIHHKKILLAEDSPDNQILVKKLLGRWGAHVDVVENGEAAVLQAMREHYDVILMDMQMPVMDGYSATKVLREKGYRRPIVAFTAHAMKEDREACLRAGCDDYLTKPINLAQALAVLSELCGRAGAFGPEREAGFH
jgi:CheY-like chemotaxis protein